MNKKNLAQDILESIEVCRIYISQLHVKWEYQMQAKQITDDQYRKVSDELQCFFGHLIGMHELKNCKYWLSQLVEEVYVLEHRYFPKWVSK